MIVIQCPQGDGQCTAPEVESSRFLGIRGGDVSLISANEVQNLMRDLPSLQWHAHDEVEASVDDRTRESVLRTRPELGPAILAASEPGGERIDTGVYVLCKPCDHVWVGSR
jgi:hypothetical protein